jgi:UDP-4-amino-4,6-dideoxy-N-acetyl-beta-L-altrosamine N-acetyltransferase
MLTGNRVSLRPLEEEDLPLLVAWRNTPRVWAGFFNRFPLSLAGQKAWYADLLRDPTRRLFAICAREDGQPAGTAGLDHIDFPCRSAELGNILIGDERRLGQGFASQAVQLLLEFSFLHLNLNRIHLEVYADNERAIRLYERRGFQREGLLRQAEYDQGAYKDVLLMSILRQEYVPRPRDQRG